MVLRGSLTPPKIHEYILNIYPDNQNEATYEVGDRFYVTSLGFKRNITEPRKKGPLLLSIEILVGLIGILNFMVYDIIPLKNLDSISSPKKR